MNDKFQEKVTEPEPSKIEPCPGEKHLVEFIDSGGNSKTMMMTKDEIAQLYFPHVNTQYAPEPWKEP